MIGRWRQPGGKSLTFRLIVVTALSTALVTASVLLTASVAWKRSQIDTLDAYLLERADDLADLNENTDVTLASGGLGTGLVGAVFDIDDAVVASSSDELVDSAIVLDQFDDGRGLFLTIPQDLRLPTLIDVPGAESMRGVLIDTIEFGDAGEAPERIVFVASSRVPIDDRAAQLLLYSLLASAALGAFNGVIVWRLMRWGLGPLRELALELESIPIDRTDRVIVAGMGRTELAPVVATINHLLQQKNAPNDQSESFLADAAHELRSPVASLQTQLDAARLTGSTGPSLVADLALDVDRLTAIVESLLTLASERAGVQDSQLVDVATVVSAVIRSTPKPEHLHVVDTGIRSARIRCDPGDFESVVSNLLSNALLHATSIVRIEVVERLDRWVEMTVDDDGPGIDPKDFQRVFGRFVRLDPSRARTSGGTGLGLSITEAAVRRSGGRIEAGASPLGGARFQVLMPGADPGP